MSTSLKQTDEHHPSGPGPEKSDANFKNILTTGIGLLGVLLLGLLGSWGVYALFEQHTATPGAPAQTFAVPDTTMLPPGPRLQADPHAVLVAMRRVEDSLLNNYTWVSKDSGIVRIPIERAMELTISKGLPARPSTVGAR